jgi:hypothetical protein
MCSVHIFWRTHTARHCCCALPSPHKMRAAIFCLALLRGGIAVAQVRCGAFPFTLPALSPPADSVPPSATSTPPLTRENRTRRRTTRAILCACGRRTSGRCVLARVSAAAAPPRAAEASHAAARPSPTARLCSPQVANPSETYPLYVLPYCPPRDGDLEAPAAAQATLGETLAGDRRVNTPCVGSARARVRARLRLRVACGVAPLAPVGAPTSSHTVGCCSAPLSHFLLAQVRVHFWRRPPGRCRLRARPHRRRRSAWLTPAPRTSSRRAPAPS